MATITGTAGSDSVAPLTSADFIIGLAGDDTLFGGIGNDRVNGGADDDFLLGGKGADQLYGGAGNDYLHGNRGEDVVQGGAGDDWARGGAARDTLEGGSGSDTLQGDKATDYLYGGDGDDLIFGGEGTDWVLGGAGNDTVKLFGDGTAIETDVAEYVSGFGNDTLYVDTIDNIYLSVQMQSQDGTLCDVAIERVLAGDEDALVQTAPGTFVLDIDALAWDYFSTNPAGEARLTIIAPGQTCEDVASNFYSEADGDLDIGVVNPTRPIVLAHGELFGLD